MKEYYLLSKVDFPLYFCLGDGREVGVGRREKIGPLQLDAIECREVDKLIKSGYLMLITREVASSQPSVQPVSPETAGAD